MCGRFALGLDADELVGEVNANYFQQDDAPETNDGGEEQQQGSSEGSGKVVWSPVEDKSGHRVRYNVCPKSKSVVIRKNGRTGQYEIDRLVWGLIPSWYKEPPGNLSTINAQVESVREGKPSWKVPREKKRCVVLAQGFYEWLQKGKDKVPHFVKRADGKLMAFAGMWDHCDYKGLFDAVTTYTIITTPVNSQLRFLHSRMPAILNDTAEIDLWLSDAPFEGKVKDLLRPWGGKVTVYPVDKGVGKVGNESPDFIQPVASKKGSLDNMFAKQIAKSPAKPQPSSLSKSTSTSPSASSKPKIKSASPPSPSSSAGKKSSGSKIDATMNPDEDTPAKVEAIAEEEGKVEGEGSGSGSAKKRKQVEVIDLADSDDEDVKPVKKSKKGKEKTKEASVEKEDVKEKHVDADGNEAISDFFPVVDA